jgi:hypothetical protein
LFVFFLSETRTEGEREPKEDRRKKIKSINKEKDSRGLSLSLARVRSGGSEAQAAGAEMGAAESVPQTSIHEFTVKVRRRPPFEE